MTESATTADLLPYLSRPMTAPSDDVRVAIERGPIATADALSRVDLDRLLDSAPLPVETGWCTLEDGTGYVAVRTHIAGVTADMIDGGSRGTPRTQFDTRPGSPALTIGRTENDRSDHPGQSGIGVLSTIRSRTLGLE
jgi:hypothetical protein